MDTSELNETVILGKTSQGTEMRGTPVRLERYAVAFELYTLGTVVRVSEVLSDFKIVVGKDLMYAGRAVVKNVVATGPTVLCEATLEDGWVELAAYTGRDHAKLQSEYRRFMERWQKHYRVLPEFKILAADMQTFLADLRLWVEQVELGIRAVPNGDRLGLEREIGLELCKATFPALDELFEKYEAVAQGIPEELQPVHRSYIKRHIHPLVLCSPFVFRTVHKPLGYAGDYEVVNMILRDPHEGPSLFGKVLNRWFIKQPPAEAHRNRVLYLSDRLAEETLRLANEGKVARVFNMGCGPAKEVEAFLGRTEISERARLTLMDFNEETLRYAKVVMENAKKRYDRRTEIEFVRKSVAQILKGKDRRLDGPLAAKYDFVYCAGLFDYLADGLCKQLMNIFYDMLAPGGLLVATNVDSSNPIRHWLGDILDWHLIYRNGKEFLALRPEESDPDWVSVRADITGVNIFLEVRRPPA